MLSDESSSDSETGRFKCQPKEQDEQKNSSSSQRKDDLRSSGRSGRYSGNDRPRREFDRNRERYDRRSRERHRYRSPPRRSRHSRERSPARKSRDRGHEVKERSSRERSSVRKSRDRGHEVKERSSRERSSVRKSRDRGHEVKERSSRERSPARKPRDIVLETRERSKPRNYRSRSRDRDRKRSRSRTRRSPDLRTDNKHENKKDLREEIKERSRAKSIEILRKSHDKSLSPEYRGKRSVVHKPVNTKPEKKKSESPIIVEDRESDTSPKEEPASYYSMVPVVKDKTDTESSEIDSSDDEKLRAKLLNLERELHKTRKKKHKRKHKKRKSSKSSKERDISAVEVSSTTDIDKTDLTVQAEEITSTQKSNQKDSSEEGEISSGDDSQDIKIDPTDLRHKLRRSKADSNVEPTPPKDTCGPALPPHLESKYKSESSADVEGPALPPHLKSKPRNIGPSIPEDMRKVLADTKHEAKDESSGEDDGIGPVPAGSEQKWSEAHVRLEERALDMKIRSVEGHSLQKSDVKAREKWMLELPEGKAKIIGLEARSFRAKEGPDMSDRSSWTDTPEEKARKAAGIAKEEDPETSLKQDARARHIANRDDEQEKAVKKHKKKHKRDESLLEMHEKKLKKKKKKDEKEDKKERRPFSRDVDLQVNRFDEAQKKAIIKKAQALDTRFSKGEAKYL